MVLFFEAMTIINKCHNNIKKLQCRVEVVV